MNPILLDTGVIVGLLDSTESGHEACLRVMNQLQRSLVTCEAVISESCFLLQHILGAPEDVIANVVQGHFRIPFQFARHAAGIQASMHKYRDVPMSFADACLVQMADELNTGDILTLDSDFRHYRWRRTRSFNLLIPLE